MALSGRIGRWVCRDLRSYGDQFYLPAIDAERNASLLQQDGVVAKDLSTPSVQGGDLGAFLQRQAVDIIRTRNEACCNVMLFGLGCQQHLQQRNQGGGGAGG